MAYQESDINRRCRESQERIFNLFEKLSYNDLVAVEQFVAERARMTREAQERRDAARRAVQRFDRNKKKAG